MTASEGYYSDLEYTSGYHHELGPAHLRFCGLLAGVDCLATETPAYLELGFGQGVALNVHAAAHVANAQVIADATGSGVRLSDWSFAALMTRDDLPAFDAIVMHGIWSWVSEENRRIIVDLIRDRLKPGGVVYVSYNCQPGWASRAPIRHLLKLGHAAAPDGDARARIAASLEFMEDVAAADSRFLAEDRPAVSHAASLRKVDPLYLAHEYLGEHWHVPYFSEVAEALGEAGLSFLGSARLLDRLDGLNLPPAAVAMLHRQKDPVMRESVRDYLVNQQFRPDVFVKGGTPLSAADQAARADAQAFVLICGLDEIDFDLTDAQGEAAMPEALYAPLAMALAADDFRPKTPVELAASSGLETVRKADLIKALTTLVGIGVLRPAQAFDAVARSRCEGFNRLVLERAVTGPHLKHLAAPAVGGGVLTTRSAQLFLRAWTAGARTADEISLSVWDVFQQTNERAVRNGQDMITREDNLAALEPMARRFVEQTVPLYRALGIL